MSIQKIKITHDNVEKISRIRKKLESLTLNKKYGDSLMRSILNDILIEKRYKLRASQYSKAFIYLHKKNRKITAWAFIGKYGFEQHEFMVYVDSKFRRRGIASELLKAAHDDFDNLIIHRWDEKSTKFYNSTHVKSMWEEDWG